MAVNCNISVPDVHLVKCLKSPLKDFDSLVIVANNLEQLTHFLDEHVLTSLKTFSELNKSFNSEITFLVNEHVPGKRLIFSPTGPVDRDFDDVRRFADAAGSALSKALSVGSRSPVLAIFAGNEFEHVNLVSLLGALEVTYVPLQIREDIPSRQNKLDRLGFFANQSTTDESSIDNLIRYARAVEFGRVVARDIGGADPERMAPPRVADYVQHIFDQSSGVKVKVVKDRKEFEKDFPLYAAVDRAANSVERHQGRLIFLEYVGEGEIDTTVMMVGKGITYDTGGLDIKAGGIMAGMSYDKCGTANVTGFFKVLAELKPKKLKAVGVLAVARNSCGEEGFVADEILTSRAGVRIRVGNTDAEGRMVMVDPLCYLKELAVNEVNPHLFTMATLTGHVIRAYGFSYTATIDNGPARKHGVSQKLQAFGDAVGDPFEISTVRREVRVSLTNESKDYSFITDQGEVADVIQCNNLASSATPRGHQFPAAFLTRVSGLDKHGLNSEKPIPYTHLDIAGSGGDLPHQPTARPIPTLCQMFVADRVF